VTSGFGSAGRPADKRERVESVLLALVACHVCDLLHEKTEIPRGAVARCVRCRSLLYANKPNSIDKISVSGNTQSISVASAVFALSDEGMWLLGALCFGFILLIPLLRVVGLIYLLVPLRFNRRLPGIELVFRGIVSLSPWSMMEIYLLGAIVALVKLATMANIELGLSFWAFAVLNILAALAAQLVDKHLLWELINSSRVSALPSRGGHGA